MQRLLGLLALATLAQPACGDVLVKGDGVSLHIFAKYGPFWRARERGVVEVRACPPDIAAKQPIPPKVPLGSDLGSKAANDVFWDKYDRWMEKVEPGCNERPVLMYTAATFKALVGDDNPDLLKIVGDRYQLLDMSGNQAFLSALSSEPKDDGPVVEPQDSPLPSALAADPTPKPSKARGGKASQTTLRLSWGGAASDLAIDQDKGLRLIKLTDGPALAPDEGGLIAIDRDGDAALKQLADAGVGYDEYDMTRKAWSDANREAWVLQEFRKIYAALGDDSRVFVLDKDLYVMAGGTLTPVPSTEGLPIEDTLVKRVGSRRTFRGARAELELLRSQGAK